MIVALFFFELLDNLLVPGGKRAIQGTHGVPVVPQGLGSCDQAADASGHVHDGR